MNQLQQTEDFNTYTYRNFFNGGGVGIGDINNDGLPDIYFCGNMKPNKLYLNKGNWQFEDITEKAGVACPGVWSTGVSMVDINGDGWLDIYVCKSGKPGGVNRHNELFINNGDLTFTEQAKQYGIADEGLSTHAAFFDYDRDGDLDCYLLNNAIRSTGGYDLIKDQRKKPDPNGGNKLYRNDGGHFTDVTQQAGIYSSAIGFGLGVLVGDVNMDGWPDIYVTNDFFERDYLYLNNHDGTFRECLEDEMQEISLSSMGADMADLNNDGFPEVFVTEMLPEANDRIKTKTLFDSWDKYQSYIQNGYYRQFTRNVLQRNNRNGTFSEIGRQANVFATDWSWGALMADFDNDGFKDIFVTNGIFKDLTDQDYLNFYSDPRNVRRLLDTGKDGILKLVESIPSKRLPNYMFRNDGHLSFSNKAGEWGLGQPSFSNGAAYGDLDNDGDLDLVVNNVNMPPFLYENNTNKLRANHYLKVHLDGKAPNTGAVGAKVYLLAQGRMLYQEEVPTRGFQSCVEARPNFGLGDITNIDNLVVSWPDGHFTVETNVPADQMLHLKEEGAGRVPSIHLYKNPRKTFFRNVSDSVQLKYHHVENDFVDFERDQLTFNVLSDEGPKMCLGDINGDGRKDIFIGGAKDSPGAILLQKKDGRFIKTNQGLLEKDKVSEDTGCLFFDADNDGDQDLYVASGGNEFPSSSSALADRLYLNDGKGVFTKSNQILPNKKFESTSCVSAADYDKDGDMDLFIGLRLRPFLYGVPADGYILNNDGKGHFTNVSGQIAPQLKNLGMITDVLWEDIDNDGDVDLVIVGEWMPVTIFENDGGHFKNITQQAGLGKSNGWWNTIAAADLDGDGDIDFVIGNHGLNSRFKAMPDKPVTMYVNDFDHNGTVEQVICAYNGSRSYPMALRNDLVAQIPSLKKKYPKFQDYKDETIQDIFTPEQLENSVIQKAFDLRTSVLINQGNNHFELKDLPAEAQYAPVYGIALGDFDKDGTTDILLGGNQGRAKPETGVYLGSYGLFLKGKGDATFSAVPATRSGISVKGDIRDFQKLDIGNAHFIVIARNNDDLETYKY